MTIQVRKDDDKPKTTTPPAGTLPTRWDPLRMLRELASWDPFREMQPFTRDVAGGFMPAFEIKETDGAYVFHADLPGVKEGDINVTVTGNRLSISGKREAEREEKGDTFYCYERSYGDFSRAFTLPEGVDANGVRADLKDGVLSVTVQKKPESQPKKIAVQSQAKKS
jgi:HSP20 family protein